MSPAALRISRRTRRSYWYDLSISHLAGNSSGKKVAYAEVGGGRGRDPRDSNLDYMWIVRGRKLFLWDTSFCGSRTIRVNPAYWISAKRGSQARCASIARADWSTSTYTTVLVIYTLAGVQRLET